MAITFDGATRRIILSSGTTTLDVRDLYSRWKDWVELGNANWPPAFSVVGGEPIDLGNGIYVTTYAFLANDWRVRPQEADHKLVVSGGVLLTDTGADPIVATLGTYNVLVQYSQPVKSETIATGGVDVNALAAAVWALIGPSGHSTMTSLEDAASESAAASAGIVTVDAKADTLVTDLTTIKKIETGRWKILNNQMVLYDDDGTTPLYVFDLKDADGNPSMTSVFERTPV